MRPDELERLLWEDAEGALDAAGRERLKDALDSVPEGRQRRQEVADLAALLGAVRAVAPPPELRARIDGVIAARPQPRRQRVLREALAALLAPQRRVQLALAAVVVAAVAAVLLLADTGRLPGSADSRFAGALVPAAAPPAAPDTVELPGGLGALTLSARGGVLLCQLRLDRTIAGGVRLTVAGEGVTASELEASGATAVPIVARRDIVGAVVTGTGSVTLEATPAELPAELEVSVDVDAGKVFVCRVVVSGERRR